MNREEARILHGLYYDREMTGEKITYTAGEIKWIAKHSCFRAKQWQAADGKKRCIEDKNEDYLARIGATSASASRPLLYLNEAGYISLEKDRQLFRISVTVAGADLARQLHTPWGQVNVWYKKHKDGILYLLITVLVSVVTTILTKKCTH
jgi:DNA-binding MarR family transcriptional regulator